MDLGYGISRLLVEKRNGIEKQTTVYVTSTTMDIINKKYLKRKNGFKRIKNTKNKKEWEMIDIQKAIQNVFGDDSLISEDEVNNKIYEVCYLKIIWRRQSRIMRAYVRYTSKDAITNNQTIVSLLSQYS